MRNCHTCAIYCLALFTFIICSPADSATVVVRQDGQGGAYTTLEDAIANSVNGEDTIEIQQFSEAFTPTGGSIDFSWRNLICTAPERATINLTAGQGLFITNRTIQKVKLVGVNDGATWQHGLVCFGNVTVDNCYITGFEANGITLYDSGNPVTTGAVIQNTYVVGQKKTEYGIYIETYDGAGKGPILIDHCTIDAPEGFPLGLKDGTTTADTTYSNLTVSNTIMTNTARCMEAGSVVDLQYVHSYNDYNTTWIRELWYWHQEGENWTFSSNTALGTGDMEKVTPLFSDADSGVYSLTLLSPCLGAGEGGTNIGAYQGDGVGYPTGDVIVRQDGQDGAYTTLTEAIIYTQSGQTIEIQQFTAPFTIPEDANVGLTNITIFCSMEEPAVIECEGSYGIVNATNVTLRNLHFKGNAANWQVGIKPGAGLNIVDCYFEDFNEAAIWFLTATYDPSSGSVRNTYFFNSKILLGNYNEATKVGSLLIDHCTLYENRGGIPNIGIDASYYEAGMDGSNLKVSNCILDTTGFCNVFAYYHLADLPLAYVHSYNDYINTWAREIWDNGNAGPMDLGTGDVNAIDPLFVDAANGDLTLQPTSPLATAGEDGTTIGADQVEGTAVKDWNLY